MPIEIGSRVRVLLEATSLNRPGGPLATWMAGQVGTVVEENAYYTRRYGRTLNVDFSMGQLVIEEQFLVAADEELLEELRVGDIVQCIEGGMLGRYGHVREIRRAGARPDEYMIDWDLIPDGYDGQEATLAWARRRLRKLFSRGDQVQFVEPIMYFNGRRLPVVMARGDLGGCMLNRTDGRLTGWDEHGNAMVRLADGCSHRMHPSVLHPLGWTEPEPKPIEPWTCAHCDEEVTTGSHPTADGDVCGDCIANYAACTYCLSATHEDDRTAVQAGGEVCDACLDARYQRCERCEEYATGEMFHISDEDRHVCHNCVTYNYSWCEDCDGYFSNETFREDHRHYDGCCSSPALEFLIRNDGLDPLPNDQTTKITLPGGTISEQGLAEISSFIFNWARAERYSLDTVVYNGLRMLARNISELGDQWQTKEGNYTKRLSRLAWKSDGIKVPPEVISQVGNIGSAHSQPIDFNVAFTRQLNLPPEEFAHSDSCWWQSYSQSRCILKTNGGLGMRTFSRYGDVTGRAWVMPLKEGRYHRPQPTFDTMNAIGFVVFNGYGDLSGYAPARILSHMQGLTYRKISFEAGEMYVNSGGYLVGPEDLVKRVESNGLQLDVARHSSLFEIEQAEKSNEKETIDA